MGTQKHENGGAELAPPFSTTGPTRPHNRSRLGEGAHMKNRLRKPVALLGTLVMAAAFLVTGSAGVANAAPAGPARETNDNWRVSRTVSNSTPSAGDTITVSSVFERRWGVAALQVVKDIHPSCLELVPGSVSFRGSTVPANRTQVEQDDPAEPGFGFVRVT